MVDPFRAAAPVFFKAFADPEQIIYIQDGFVLGPISAIWTDDAAAGFPGAGSTLRKLTYEVQQSDLPERPTKRDSFVHHERRWEISDVTRRDDIGAWWLVVVDAGAA